MQKRFESFLGVPVIGDLSSGSSPRVAQRSQQELSDILSVLVRDTFIVEFGWRQYTPYFNDGEPCEFGVGGFWVRTVLDVGDGDEKEYGREEALSIGWGMHPTLGGMIGPWRLEKYEGSQWDRYQMCLEASKAIEGGAFEDVLLELFGDHAEVTVHKDKITIEEYHHE